LYREYISLRCPYSSTFLISLSFPDHLLSSLQTADLHFSHTWKESIWCCRTRTPLPERLQYVDQVELVRGNICTKLDIAKLQFAELEDEIGERDVFVHKGKKGMQWCFLREERVREVISLGGKVHVKVFSPSLRVSWIEI
jgi:hypothetical protein